MNIIPYEEKISVIMSVYKENRLELKQSIESILNQTYKNIEFIIIIDYPEETWRKKFIENYNDSRIKLLINAKNFGLTYSLNRALGVATGQYIARMDADDISMLNRLEKQLIFLKQNNCDLCGSYMLAFNDFSETIYYYPTKSKNIKKLLKERNCIAHPTWFGKRELFVALNGYRTIFACEDYDFLIRAIQKNYKLCNVNEVLLKYRLSNNSISRSNFEKQEIIANFLSKKFKKNQKISEEEVNRFINSNFFCKKVERLKQYNKLRNKYKNSFVLNLLFLNFSYIQFRKKVINKCILSIEGANNDKKNNKFY